jgi:hypothetical protein
MGEPFAVSGPRRQRRADRGVRGGLAGGHQDHRRSELLQPLCHCAVAARSDLRESGTATMSALNLWNKNTERVSDALSRDRGHLHFSVVSKHVAGQVILRADNLRYGQLAAPNTATTG